MEKYKWRRRERSIGLGWQIRDKVKHEGTFQEGC